MAQVKGQVAAGFEGVADAFERVFDDRPDMGAALAIRVAGKPVVDLWGGVRDARTGELWEEDTATVVFSVTKGLMSILVARLVEEGVLDYNAPVAEYWPEFAAAGKQSVTVADALAHRAGLSALSEPLTVDEVTDWDFMTGLLAEQAPLWEPGTGHAYHAMTHGWLVGEIIRRVTGETVKSHFRRQMSPWSADAWIGLPASEADRVAHIQAGPSLDDMARALSAAPDRWTELAMTLGGALPPYLVGDTTGFNDPRIRAAEMPGAGGIATARAVAAIWSSTIMETDGVRLLKGPALEQALQPVSEGAPVFSTPPPWHRWGFGFHLDSELRRLLSPRSFGHDGAGGQVAFADPAYGVGFAFVTNWLESGDDRGTSIIDALRAVLGRSHVGSESQGVG